MDTKGKIKQKGKQKNFTYMKIFTCLVCQGSEAWCDSLEGTIEYNIKKWCDVACRRSIVEVEVTRSRSSCPMIEVEVFASGA